MKIVNAFSLIVHHGLSAPRCLNVVAIILAKNALNLMKILRIHLIRPISSIAFRIESTNLTHNGCKSACKIQIHSVQIGTDHKKKLCKKFIGHWESMFDEIFVKNILDTKNDVDHLK